MEPLTAYTSYLLFKQWPVIVASACALVYIVQFFNNRIVGKFPPGPRGWPVIGNVLDIPLFYPWKVYRQWGREADSDIISLKLPGPPLVVLNSAAAADALLTKRSGIYSDRPRMVMLNTLVRADWNLALMPYGERFKAARKLFNKHVDVPYARPQAVLAARKLLKDLLTNDTHDPSLIMRLMTGRFILGSAYGIVVDSPDDPYIKISETFIKSISHATQRGAFLVDFFPSLKYIPSWFPGANFQRLAARLRKVTHDARTLPFKYSEERVEKGSAQPSFSKRFLESVQDDTMPEEIDDVRSIMGNMYIAGADTTVLAMRTFVLAMSLYPEIQRKCQEAVDVALGGERLPDFSDFGRIPYIDAIISEVLRWKPPLPLSVPHGVTEDDYYNGFLIPKGSIVVANICAILQDENVYGPNTDMFVPERFITSDSEKGGVDTQLSSDAAFGYGRRQCPGRVMAKELMWITITSILATFDIHSPVDQDGVPLKPNVEYGPAGNLNYPPEYRCVFVLRNSQAKSWIEEPVEDSE